MTDFTDQLEADVQSAFVSQAEFGELVTFYDPDTETTTASVKVLPQDLPDTKEEEIRVLYVDSAAVTPTKNMRVTTADGGADWRVVATGKDEIGLTEIEIRRHILRD